MELADIFNASKDEYLVKYGKNILPSHKRAIHEITTCRTKIKGGHVYSCDHCDEKTYSYHSCKNRACCKCGNKDTEAWVVKQEKRLLPCHYFHIVLTLPHELNDIIKSNQRIAYNVLFSSAKKALFKVLKTNVFGKAVPGCMAALHTWSRPLAFHTHVHLLVPGIAWDKDNSYVISSDKKFLVADKKISSVFRAIFVKQLRKKIPGIVIPEGVWKKDWVVKTLPVLAHTKAVLNYLSRYTRKTAITNNRILDFKNGEVTFKYIKVTSRETHTMTLPALDFMSRFLQHVLPKGFIKIRHYGLCHAAYKNEVGVIQEMFDCGKTNEDKEKKKKKQKIKHPRCPHCKQGDLFIIEILLPQKRGPP